MKIHAKLKWSTIFYRIDKQYSRMFLLDSYGSIYEYSSKDNAWLWCSSSHSKHDFIDWVTN